MKKALIVYFSYEGNIRSIVHQIQNELDIPSEELNPQNRLPEKRSLITMLHGGKSALFKEEARLSPLKFNPEDFEIIILAWPLWAWTLPPAMREFLDKYPFCGKKVILVVSSSSGAVKKCIEKVKEILHKNQIVASFSFRDPLKREAESKPELERLINTVRKIIQE